MTLRISDWQFRVDVEATLAHTTKNASDHCECAYCRNYYEALEETVPELMPFLAGFGINYHGPSELMPFEPTLMLACYRVQGAIEQWGRERIWAGDVLITPEGAEDGSFLLWVGEVQLPWLQQEPVEDVVSPANLPEFLERMQEIWRFRHESGYILS